MMNFSVLGGEKTKPIQSQTKPILISPQHCWGLKTQVEKTKPISERLNECKCLYEMVLWGISWFWAVGKQSQTKPICSYCVLRDEYCGKEKGKNARKFGGNDSNQ